MYSLEELLKHVVNNNASDLHLSVGTQPRIRQNGILTPIDGEKLSPNNLTTIISEHLTKERITKGVADDLEEHLAPLGAAVIIEAAHGCMQCRGVQKQNSIMTTSAMRGVFFDKSEARSELMQLIQSPPL